MLEECVCIIDAARLPPSNRYGSGQEAPEDCPADATKADAEKDHQARSADLRTVPRNRMASLRLSCVDCSVAEAAALSASGFEHAFVVGH
jgi:hypothetical protein